MGFADEAAASVAGGQFPVGAELVAQGPVAAPRRSDGPASVSPGGEDFGKRGTT